MFAAARDAVGSDERAEIWLDARTQGILVGGDGAGAGEPWSPVDGGIDLPAPSNIMSDRTEQVARRTPAA